MPKLQLSFSGTFALKKEDLLKILRVAEEEQGLKSSTQGLSKEESDQELSERTGLGIPKLRMRGWASRSGLVADDFLSPEGKLVLDKDPYLESPITNWLMHFYLSLGDKGLQSPPTTPADWGGWTYFVYTFLPSYRAFTSDDLVHTSALVFEQEPTKSLTKNFKFVLRAYTEEQAIANCKFLIQEDNQYVAGQADLPNPYLVGYFLAKLWERDFPNDTSALTESILNHPMGLAPVLGLSVAATQEQLNTLESHGIIEQRRAVPPFQVIPRWDAPLTLLEKAYDSDR
ncbi:DUF4007 family protein [Stenomitos frigidus]|uniref:DUF4007 domain-containing protein n=1 Tax=Stenomitos frigidus ULC18 TaxID=2107698 RepID=A0A2T1EE50_9CYAN|nr:DUF4007 family protein [Stenomitos frigidus]PSB31010.1 hypothetical protein C7B82_07780 [Stenomitos frigidus ULC18]